MTTASLHPPDTRLFRICRTLSHVGLLAVAAGLVTSPALISIGIIVMVVPAWVSMPPALQFRRWLHGGMLLWLPMLLLPLLASWFWTFQKQAWATDLIIKLPLCLAPYSIAVLGMPSWRWVRGALWLLLITVAVASTGTVADYLLHKEEMDALIAMSKPMHTFLGSPHIYFSVISAFTVLAAYWLWRQDGHLLHKAERWLAFALGLLIFAFMHVITTRTGLVALYLTVGILAIVQLLAKGKWLLVMDGLLAVVLLQVIAYNHVPSLRNRVDNTHMDVTRYFDGKDPNYLSIGTRIESYKVALSLIQRSHWMGVGMGDLKDEMNYQYVLDDSDVCPENQIEPHNQFIQICAGLGIVPCLLFAVAWFSPLVRRWRPAGEGLFWPFWVVFTLAMFAESMVERQVGVGFLVLALALFYTTPALRQAESPA